MDDELRARLAEDLEDGFECLVLCYQHLVYGIAYRAIGSAPDAEEVTQDAFVRAHRALERYPAERIRELKLRGWLARITLNLVYNRLRDGRAGGKRTAAQTLSEAALESKPDGADGPEAAWERRESAESWARLLAGLPEHYRRAVELRHVEGLSYQELAEALHRPLGTVKAHVHRGVRLLREAYEAHQAQLERA